MPTNNNIVDIFAPVSGSFVLAATMTGIYYPSGPLNTIIDWESQSAYKIKMNAPAFLPIIGPPEINKTLTMQAGWSLIPVICNYPLDAANTLEPLDLEVAKDVAGTGVLWPGMGINTLDNLDPGMAYYVLLNSGGSITFPANSDKAVVIDPTVIKLPKNPWNELRLSSFSHLIAIMFEGMQDIRPDDIIGVFSPDNNCYGVTEIGDLGQNPLITAYSDDMTTDEKDGFINGEAFSFRLYRPESQETINLEVRFDPELSEQEYFANEGLSAISSIKAGTTGIINGLVKDISIYPNPSQGIFTIEGYDKIIKIRIFNTFGDEIYTRELNLPSKVNLSFYSKGVYFVKIETDNKTYFEKLVIN